MTKPFIEVMLIEEEDKQPLYDVYVRTRGDMRLSVGATYRLSDVGDLVEGAIEDWLN